MNATIQAIALRTIEIEAASISGLSKFVNDDFEKAVNAVHHCKGRFIVSGVGKSGIIAQKIAATLNSTGTPSLYMHAADAIHGDLGMVQKDDVIMLISKSGESPEIKVLVPLLKNFGNPLIGMSGNHASFLARNADYFLNTMVETEACPNGLAPTSSTTAQLVMGDAMAVCLMELKGFNGQDFARFHPGGNLGKRMYLRVQDLYADNPKPYVSPDANLKEIIVEMTQKRLGATAVVGEDGHVLGVITDGDLRRMLTKDASLNDIKASDILSPNPKQINPEELAVKALDVLRTHDISQLIVVNQQNIYLGMLHLHDLVKEGIV